MLDYKPWLKIQDVSSLGRSTSTRLKGIKTNRQHGLLSDLKRNCFYLTEYSDFIIDIDKGHGVFEVTRTIKMKDVLLRERVIERFEIEREYWQRRDIDWGIVTEEEIPKITARNISYIHDYYNIQDFDVFREISSQYIGDLSIALLQRLLNNNRSICTIANEFDKDVHLPLGSSVTLFYYLLAQKIIRINRIEPSNIGAHHH